MEKQTVSIILPVHNEAAVLRANVKRLRDVLKEAPGSYEIIISEDGSTDNTVEIAKGLETEGLRVLHHDIRLGKGAAIKNAAAEARGRIIIFMDADLASNPAHIRELVDFIGRGAAIVIGSRYLGSSNTKRSLFRHIASRTYNWLVRIMLGSRLSDHQCGFKAFRKDLVLPLINEVEEEGWFWDTELLVRAQRKGLFIAEIPIEWREARGSQFNLLGDSWRMAKSLIRFRLRSG